MKLKKIKENIWEIPKTGKMKVPGRIFASDILMEKIVNDGMTLKQVKNVAQLPGIRGYSMAMMDAHCGYGFSIGGVAGFDTKKGIVTPGGVGYDIGCGVRLLATNLSNKEFLKNREKLTHQIKRDIPSGVGQGSEQKIDLKDIDEILVSGASWALKKGLAEADDLKFIESNGKISGADPKKLSQKAKARGRNQLGTLGSGNHFLEIQEVNEIYDKKTAKTFGIEKTGQIVIMIHTGSRGIGHQVASDYIQKIEKEYGFKNLPDRELMAAPIQSDLGKEYLSAMAAAANFAFASRQVITHKIRSAFKKFFPKSTISLVYDLTHNVAKFEKHKISGKTQELCVHRKGATRSFGPSRSSELPKKYAKTGQPVLIPGSMGTFSYILAGTDKASELSLASTAHGAGRVMSRSAAMRDLKVEDVRKKLKDYDVYIEAGSEKGMVQEAPEAYKDVNEVVRVSDELGIGKLVARFKPLAVIKG